VNTKTKHSFVGEVPNAAYSSWHCKYKISAASTLVPDALDATMANRNSNNGYIVLEAQ
jgi:hypothetical protein